VKAYKCAACGHIWSTYDGADWCCDPIEVEAEETEEGLREIGLE